MSGVLPPKSIDEVARETQEAIIKHIQANTEEDDARREAERDARVAAVLKRLTEEGKLPPRTTSVDKPTSG
ncbi:MAG: hypothetical protein FJ090_11335 [Deltaproteobacteria bacterium]|nr:hypothetical protein [Deltaproteobacteria bacterium]